MKRDLFERRPVVLLVLIVLLFFWKLAFSDQFTFLESSDLAYQVVPWYQVQARAWNSGSFPMWDPYQWTGQPLFGQMQPGAAFPLNWPLFKAPLGEDGYIQFRYIHWHFVLMHVLAGLFMYAFVRDLGRSRYASLIAGTAFACSGYVGGIGWPQKLHGALWVPLIFLFFHRLAAARASFDVLTYSALCGGAIGMSLLSGHHEAPLFILLALTGLFLFQLYERKQHSTREALRLTGGYALAAVFACFVAALQLLPAFEYGNDAYRWVGAESPVTSDVSVPYYVQRNNRLFPVELMGAVIPRAHFQASTFVGFFCLAMAVYALALCWKQRWVRVYSCLGLGALVYTLGPLSVLHGWIYTFVPYADKARTADHAIFVAQFAVFLLAAHGIDHLFSSGREESVSQRWMTYIERTLVAFGLLSWVFQFDRVLDAKMDAVPDQIMVAGLTAFVLAAVLHGLRRGFLSAPAARAAFLLLMVFEMSSTVWREMPHRSQPDGQKYLARLSEHKDIMEFLKAQPRPFRFEMFQEGQSVNLGDWEGVESSDGYLASVSRDLYDFLGRDWNRHKLMLNTVYTVAKEQQRPEQIEVFRDQKGWKVFRNPDASPRAWIVHDVADIESLKGSRSEPPKPEACEGEEAVTFDHLGMQRTRATARLACAGYVIFADPLLPGWRARLDGVEVPIYRAHGALRGIAVPAGQHQIEFVYRPMSVILGGALTATGFLVCGALLLFAWRRGALLPFPEESRPQSEETVVAERALEAMGAAASRENVQEGKFEVRKL